MFIAGEEDLTVLIIRIRFRNGVHQLAGGVDIAGQNVGNRHAAFHAALPAEEDGVNTVILCEIIEVQYGTCIQNDDRFFEGRRNAADETLFDFRQFIVILDRPAVNAFG